VHCVERAERCPATEDLVPSDGLTQQFSLVDAKARLESRTYERSPIAAF